MGDVVGVHEGGVGLGGGVWEADVFVLRAVLGTVSDFVNRRDGLCHEWL